MNACAATIVFPTLASTWSRAMLMGVVDVSIVVIALAMLLCVYRLVRGPHLADRALAVDTFSVELIGLILLLTMRWQTAWFIDGIMVLSLMGFAGTVAMAQYIARPHLRRRQFQQQSQTQPRTPQ